MQEIKVGDVVKKKASEETGPEAWVTVLEKEVFDTAEPIKYRVLQSDGSIETYTGALLTGHRHIYV